MISAISDIMLGYISGLSFMDKTAGLVRKVTINGSGKDGKAVRQTFPVGCNVSPEECIRRGLHTDLVPNTKFKSIHYFEDVGGVRFLERSGDRFYYECFIRLVGWLNGKALGRDDCYLSADAVMNIVKAFPDGKPVNSGIFSTMEFTQAQEVKKDASIFSSYTYDEPKTQYLMHPFDYYAVDFRVTFNVHKNCVPEFEVNPPEVC